MPIASFVVGGQGLRTMKTFDERQWGYLWVGMELLYSGNSNSPERAIAGYSVLQKFVANELPDNPDQQQIDRVTPTKDQLDAMERVSQGILRRIDKDLALIDAYLQRAVDRSLEKNADRHYHRPESNPQWEAEQAQVRNREYDALHLKPPDEADNDTGDGDGGPSITGRGGDGSGGSSTGPGSGDDDEGDGDDTGDGDSGSGGAGGGEDGLPGDGEGGKP
ncbi:hypothetical protein [Pseudomarimonas arenosa]|uniref:Uncharacterized protein n=1 Tax=Pseudomarimonas arenosa TaxID=2774145 RepID=A0AAW3ZQ11_9GAMM|nr:hypothetical protein [Pseudomarimonas arenosa]MBD8526406.1 hypothetical protein [Pseudomarimonas arenosa]